MKPSQKAMNNLISLKVQIILRELHRVDKIRFDDIEKLEEKYNFLHSIAKELESYHA